MILGVICIIAGIFVLFQSFGLTVLTALANTIAPMALSFIVVGVSLLVSGIMAIVYSSGRKRKFLFRCALANVIAATAAIACNAGDLRFWFVVCLMIAAYYLVRFWYVGKLEEIENEPEVETYVDPERLAQNNPASSVSADSAPECNGEDYPNP